MEKCPTCNGTGEVNPNAKLPDGWHEVAGEIDWYVYVIGGKANVFVMKYCDEWVMQLANWFKDLNGEHTVFSRHATLEEAKAEAEKAIL